MALDSNQNPAGARNDEYRSQLALSYAALLAGWDWQTTASLSHLTNPVEQGFLVDGYDAPGTGPNAEGFRQDKRLTEAFFDIHLSRSFGEELGLTFGFNDAYSNGNATSTVFDYEASLDGGAPSPAIFDGDGSAYAGDLRNYTGVYGLSHWRFERGFTLTLGLRENLTNEDRYTFDADDGASISTYRSIELSKSVETELASPGLPLHALYQVHQRLPTPAVRLQPGSGRCGAVAAGNGAWLAARARAAPACWIGAYPSSP